MKPEDKLDEILNKHSDLWGTKSAYLSFIRGGVRRGCWEKHPVKLQVINQRRLQIPNTNPRGKKSTVWGCKCEICDGLFPQSMIQVDHIRSHFSKFTEINDIQQFVMDMVMVTKDDLRLICKPCHEIISRQQKYGISFEQAKIEKHVISLDKDNKVVDTLNRLGVNLQPTTKAKRKALLLEILLKDLENKDV